MFRINKEEFLKPLNLAVEWTDVLSRDFDFQNGFYGTVFRNTNPVINGIPLYSFDGDYTTWNIDEHNVENYELALEQAISTRISVKNKLSYNGKILCFTIGLTTNDGAAIVDSHCFFDESDVPPIDTWFYIIDNNNDYECEKANLFCWIPTGFIEVVQRGIDGEMMGSYLWLEIGDLLDVL
jgi:hypothetical protein